MNEDELIIFDPFGELKKFANEIERAKQENNDKCLVCTDGQ